jgi:transposase
VTGQKAAGDTAPAANTGKVTDLRREARDLKEIVAQRTLELRLLEKACWAMGAAANEIPRS